MLIESTPPDDWQSFQQRVAQILYESKFVVKVEPRLRGSRGAVEVDVYARDETSTPPMTYIVECKWWKKRVSQSVVHSFRAVVDDLGANIGIIVSQRGFNKGCYEAANNTNILLLTWEEFQKQFIKRWCQHHFSVYIRGKTEPLVEYTSLINTRIFRKAERLSEDKRAQFRALRKKYQVLGILALESYTWFLLRDLQALEASADNHICASLLHVLARLKGSDEDSGIPADILKAQSLREYAEALVKHAQVAIEEFDSIFGERA